jgi:hypothetical protein
MASHFSDIGFRYAGSRNREADLDHVLDEAQAKGEVLRSRLGPYIAWCPGSGAEVWLQVYLETSERGFHPHFSGPARVRMGVTEVILDDRSALDGAIHGWVSPETDDPESGICPLLVNVPNFRLVDEQLHPPVTTTVQIAAFSHGLYCFRTREEYFTWQREMRRPRGVGALVRRLLRREPKQDRAQRLVFAAESLVPVGMFGRAYNLPWKPEDRPKEEAQFSGTVLEAERLTNPATGREFWHALVRCLGGTFDVVADPAIVAGKPARGAIVHTHAWLSGRLVEIEAGTEHY